MPTTKAKTAYGLLGAISKVIAAEPKRYDQNDVLLIRQAGHHADKSSFPECGTVGCVAGWVVALTHRDPVAVVKSGRVLTTAKETLGITWRQSEDLFYRMLHSPAQTARHAAQGVRHIERFRQQHRAQLLKTPVVIGGRS